jgi:excisionase family DNA binding protein
MTPREPWEPALARLLEAATRLEELARRLEQVPAQEPLALSLANAARALEVSERTVQRLVADGELDTVRIGRLVRVTADSLRQYLRRQAEREEAREQALLRLQRRAARWRR